ncbi:arginase family protein [Methylovirgula sp. 4M-Z18]|uniref:arginase family protein n=1 Tax=Methylovirgula sp. 4M-Z18 TaxID=2293567 RepID=UPI000E2FE822|nr:arginase family protein [Methylovirgula sp. 4M-Z18]RFB78933.1 arginase family protein [Methylovirgula sp. 4M-Z18]
MHKAYTVFQGRAGDHNDLAIPGARAIGAAMARRTGIAPALIGTPEQALNVGWREELDAAMPALRDMQARFNDVFAGGAVSIAATSRCAVSLATLPAVAKHHPAACIVWFDSHADLNTPDVTTSGYLGGLALAAPVGLWESGLGAGFALDQIVLVGERDLDPFEQELIARHRIPHIKPKSDLVAELRNAIAGRPVYMHLDCDVLNPGIVPTDYAHEGGLSLEDLRTCCAAIAAHEVVGLEIAEFQNAWTPGGEPVSPEPLLDALAPILDKS